MKAASGPPKGPAGQTFHFRRTEDDPSGIDCASASGSEYRIARDEESGRWTCTCPTTPEQCGPHGCKHLTGWAAVRTAHAMAKSAQEKAAA